MDVKRRGGGVPVPLFLLSTCIASRPKGERRALECGGRAWSRALKHLTENEKPFNFTLIIKGGFTVEVSEIVALYVEIIREALPFVLVFWIGEFIVTTFLRSAFTGRLSFKL